MEDTEAAAITPVEKEGPEILDDLDVSRVAIFASLIQAAHKDPVAREAIYAGLRTAMNVGIGIGDFGPIVGAIAGTLGMPGIGTIVGGAAGAVGETASYAADGWKGIVRSVRYLTFGKIRLPDLTPDVGLGLALGSEVADIAIASAIPTHLLIETQIQYRADKPRMKRAWAEARERAVTKKADRIAAMNTFLVDDNT